MSANGGLARRPTEALPRIHLVRVGLDAPSPRPQQREPAAPTRVRSQRSGLVPVPSLRVVTPAQVREARRILGRQLADCRKAAAVTQEELAVRTLCSRSTIANIETGRQKATKRFWYRVDQVLGAQGVLVSAFDQFDDLLRAAARLAVERELERREDPALGGQSSHGPECGCSRTVARWGGQETKALREALRMSVRAFAEHLGVTTATVGGWERRQSPKAPRLSTQDVLDQALKLAEVDARTRFWDLLDQP